MSYQSKYTGPQIDEAVRKVLAGGIDSGDFVVTNTSGWLAKSVAHGKNCEINLSWSSLQDGLSTGNGTLKVSVNGAVKTVREIEQGAVSIDVGSYLILGANDVQVTISDAYGNYRTIIYTVSTVSFSISSYFDATVARTGDIPYGYTPVGEAEKTVHFLIDGKEIGTQTVTATNREQSFSIPAQAHGSHTLEVYFTGEVDGSDVESNHLYYDLICYEDGNTTPIIATPFNAMTVKQYATVVIPYSVYTPGSLTSEVSLFDGTTSVADLTVDRTQQTWSYKAKDAGSESLSIVCGTQVRLIEFTVAESDVKVEAETSNLELHLTAEGRSNNEAEPLVWRSGNVSATMTGFNLSSDGWKSDSDGNTVLRVSGDARVEIPFNIFATDFRTTGKTIEIELATRDVRNYDAVVLSSWSGERGIKVTAQKAMLKSEQSEVYTQYKEDEHIRVTFCVEKRAENRLLSIYINGIMSGVVQYPDDDDFAQSSPVGISIGSNDCTVDVYCIRVYGNNLTRYQIVNNWIADTQDVEVMTERYLRNDVFDAYGNIAIASLPTDVPYLVINAASYSALPQSKGDKKTVSGSYVDPLNADRSFTFEDAEIDVQGTSSQYYARKNYKIKFNGGFTINGIPQETYQLRKTSMPTDTFTFKADVASSEGANNVELAMFYDDTCPVKTPPQQADSRVRQGIEGYPCLAFYYDGTSYNFLGKYNFNNDKATEEVFGFEDGDESWEILQNNTDMVIWKDDDFSGDAWKQSFEGRYPDKNTDTTNLAAFSAWLKSTDTTAVSNDEEKAARLAKFKAEFGDWCNVDAMLFNYIFTEAFLMVDNRAKNAFPTRYDEDGKWLILPYDFDTAIGINNEGELKFGYELEDTDTVNGSNVYNGQDSVLYVNMRLAFADEIKAMYQELRSGDIFSYDEIERRFEEHQAVWGASIYNEDAKFKYLDPLVNEGNKTYLPMLQGSKAEQRKWWLYNRFRYLDSKYQAGDNQEDYIMLRAYAVDDIKVTPYADIYASAKFDSTVVQKRALRGSTYTLENPLTGGNDAVISIYAASQLASVGDLSGLKPGMADFSKAIRLSSLKVGSNASGYTNPNLTDLTIGNLTLLKELDVRNCTALAQSVDLSGCTNLERAYFEGTAITGVKLPNGGILKTLHLPATVTGLTILNQPLLTDFSIPSYANVTTLRLEGVDMSKFDSLAIVEQMPSNSRVRLVGVDWRMDDVADIYPLYDKLDTFRGLDENGNTTDNVVITGKIYIPAITATDLETLSTRYPSIEFTYDTILYSVRFISEGEVISHLRLAAGGAITVPSNPTKESTAQYTYTFSGWSTDGGTIILPAYHVGEVDLTYYAVFEQHNRTYTIRFLNDDGSVLSAYNAAYGSIPVYEDTPASTQEGAWTFSGWYPEVVPITGDADYTAQYVARKSLDEYSWSEISAISEEGTGANFFNLGECKAITLSGTVGTIELNNLTLYAYILGFNHNSEIEGNGITFGTFKSAAYNGIDLCLVDSKYQSASTDGTMYFNMNHWGNSNHGGWAGCDMRYDILGSTNNPPSGYGTQAAKGRVGYDPSGTCTLKPIVGTLMAALPAELRAVMKPMTKYTDNVGGQTGHVEANVTATIDYLPLLAEFEIYGSNGRANMYEKNKQVQYAYFAAGNSNVKYKHSSIDSAAVWWERSPGTAGYNGFWYVSASGNGTYNAYYPYGVAPIFLV